LLNVADNPDSQRIRGADFMAKHEITDAELRAQVRVAAQRYARRRATGLVARAVHYDAEAGRVVVDLRNGLSFQFAPSFLPELRGANAEILADVSIDPMGVGLRWEQLDTDYELSGLLHTLFGQSWAMRELGRVGGSIRSLAKARASRANGAKGGRPPTRAAASRR
jgi:hypothetical protein